MPADTVHRPEIVPQPPEPLESNGRDALVAALKGLAGLIPGVGWLVGELLGATIPGQRLDRVIDTMGRLEAKLETAGQDIEEAKKKLASLEMLPVVEEALHQASRAFTEERRQHLANLLAVGVLSPDLDRARLLAVLQVLRDLADEEIIILAGKAHLPGTPPARAFFEKHHDLVAPRPPVIGGTEESRVRHGLHEYRLNRLERLGLLKPGVAGPNAVTKLGDLVLSFLGVDIGRPIRL